MAGLLSLASCATKTELGLTIEDLTTHTLVLSRRLACGQADQASGAPSQGNDPRSPWTSSKNPSKSQNDNITVNTLNETLQYLGGQVSTLAAEATAAADAEREARSCFNAARGNQENSGTARAVQRSEQVNDSGPTGAVAVSAQGSRNQVGGAVGGLAARAPIETVDEDDSDVSDAELLVRARTLLAGEHSGDDAGGASDARGEGGAAMRVEDLGVARPNSVAASLRAAEAAFAMIGVGMRSAGGQSESRGGVQMEGDVEGELADCIDAVAGRTVLDLEKQEIDVAKVRPGLFPHCLLCLI